MIINPTHWTLDRKPTQSALSFLQNMFAANLFYVISRRQFLYMRFFSELFKTWNELHKKSRAVVIFSLCVCVRESVCMCVYDQSIFTPPYADPAWAR